MTDSVINNVLCVLHGLSNLMLQQPCEVDIMIMYIIQMMGLKNRGLLVECDIDGGW
jgi:hypothetical protein